MASRGSSIIREMDYYYSEALVPRRKDEKIGICLRQEILDANEVSTRMRSRGY